WAQSSIPVELEKETFRQQEHYQKNGTTLLQDYLALELKKDERIIVDNEHFVALVPFWAALPYETMIISKRAVQNITEFTQQEKEDLANTLRELTIRYDNIFKTSFP